MSSSYRPVVAVAGLNGALGQATIDALLSAQFMSSFQLPIRILMRTPLDFRGPVYPAGMVNNTLLFYCFVLLSIGGGGFFFDISVWF